MDSTAARLDSALTTASQHWGAAASLWKDNVRWRFENEHWNPLESQTRATLAELERLEHVIAQAKSKVR